MKKTTFALILNLLPTLCFAQLPDSSLFAGSGKDTTIVAGEQPSFIHENLTYFRKGNGSPIDTIDVADGRVQIVLKDDNTWFMIKNLDYVAGNDVFSDHWKTNVINPYGEAPIDSLHYRNTICLVDSLSTFVCPHKRAVFSKYGYRHGRTHTGVDLPYPTGTPVYAAFDGCVRASMYYKGYGNIVIIRHENGLETYYAHLSRRDVDAGQWVHSGDVIGLGGSTGHSTGPHLHFETRFNGYCFDPEWIIDFERGTLKRNVLVLKRNLMSPYAGYIPTSVDDEDALYMTEEQIQAEKERIAKEKAAMRYHTVRSGETISHIAIKEHVSIDKIKRLNPKLNINKISIGQKIRVN